VSDLAKYFRPIVLSMRPKQWVKNFMVFPALVFSGRIFDPLSVIVTFGGFIVFCLLAGGVYVYNDLTDVERDRRHPDKSRRPIASVRMAIIKPKRMPWINRTMIIWEPKTE